MTMALILRNDKPFSTLNVFTAEFWSLAYMAVTICSPVALNFTEQMKLSQPA
jgi:hypothetical protein